MGEDSYPPPSGSVSRRFTSVSDGAFNQARSNHGSRTTVLDGGSLANTDSQAMFDHGSRIAELDGSSLARLRQDAQPSSQQASEGAHPVVNPKCRVGRSAYSETMALCGSSLSTLRARGARGDRLVSGDVMLPNQ